MNKKNKIGIAVLSLVVILILPACLAEMGVKAEFEESINQYKKLLLAQYFDKAGLYAAEKIEKEFSARTKAAKNIKVVDYRIQKAKYDETKNSAELEVEIDYFLLSNYKLKTLVDIQKWEYVNEKGIKQWKLTSLMPEFP